MKKEIYVLAIVLFALNVNAENVIISQVYYDPVATESGGEAVELFNPNNYDVDLSNYVLKTESSANDAVLPAGSIIKARSYFLIADAGWSTLKDNSEWPNADHEEAITLTNTDAGVALLNNGTILDAAGWGAAANILEGLYETNPATGAASGYSLKRINNQDTNDNSVDFMDTLPDLKNSLFQETQQENYTIGSSEKIEITAIVQNSEPVIDYIEVLPDDNNAAAGAQVNALPGNSKLVNISARISDNNGNDDIKKVYFKVDANEFVMNKTNIIDPTTALYTGFYEMKFYDEPKEYNVEIFAEDFSGKTTSINTSFTYQPLTALEIDTTNIFVNIEKTGNYTTVQGDDNINTSLPTIRNIGNTEIDIGVYGNDLIGAKTNISISNINYNVNGFIGTLKKNLEIIETKLKYGFNSAASFGLSIFVPASTPLGNYTGETTILAVSR